MACPHTYTSLSKHTHALACKHACLASKHADPHLYTLRSDKHAHTHTHDTCLIHACMHAWKTAHKCMHAFTNILRASALASTHANAQKSEYLQTWQAKEQAGKGRTPVPF